MLFMGHWYSVEKREYPSQHRSCCQLPLVEPGDDAWTSHMRDRYWKHRQSAMRLGSGNLQNRFPFVDTSDMVQASIQFRENG
jgi:hypothetical protein